jgi:hypothetical protein
VALRGGCACLAWGAAPMERERALLEFLDLRIQQIVRRGRGVRLWAHLQQLSASGCMDLVMGR